MTGVQAARCFFGILRRECLRILHQRERLLAAFVRPLLWLFVFAAGIRALPGNDSLTLANGSVVAYDSYILPGLMVMVVLFNGMQNSLSMVYDREMGSMRVLLISPFPRWYVLMSKMLVGTTISVAQVAVFLAIAAAAGIEMTFAGAGAALVALVPCGLMLGALGMLVSSALKQIENFAGIMNFLIFPMIFLSTALYPLDRMRTAGEVLFVAGNLNPFTHAVEFVRSALQCHAPDFHAAIVLVVGSVFVVFAVWAYDPSRGILGRRPSSGA